MAKADIPKEIFRWQTVLSPSRAWFRLLNVQFLTISACSLFGDSGPLLGAIRWDAWHKPRTNVEHGILGGASAAVMASLGPKAYQYRLPFFAQITGENTARVDGYTPEIMGREIDYAKAGGLGYWAFLLYEEGTGMSEGLETYLLHPRRAEMPFCVIVPVSLFRSPKEFAERMQRLVGYARDPAYLRQADGRLPIFLYHLKQSHVDTWGGPDRTRRLFDLLRGAVRRATGVDINLVVLERSAKEGAKLAKQIGANGISSYATPGGVQTASPFAALDACAEKFWNQCLATECDVVPLCMAGWDRRPRIEHPVPWNENQKPGEGMERHYAMPTPEELAAHLRKGFDFVATNRARCPGQLVLTYAWNEHDEGGFLCPTLRSDGGADTSRLEAISKMVHSYRMASSNHGLPVR
ncbi:MAG: hypothetical protein J0L75_14790 [Spirochaetes bacterium]|nr:hypothetical protein [Spirochaetota bacterium]